MFNLSDIHGRKYLTGMDSNGNKWKQFELDYHENPYRNYCDECGMELEFGWKNKNNPGQVVCDREINYDGMIRETEWGSPYQPSVVPKSSRTVLNNWWL